MRRTILTLGIISSFALSACDDPNQQEVIGTGVASAAIGAIAANALGGEAGWNIAAATAAGVAGALYARNRQTNECAYHSGDGETVYVRDCPQS